MQNVMSQYGNSSVWMTPIIKSSGIEETDTIRLYRLASVKKAISNFVSIVTSQQIPVKFANHGNSYTDGHRVVLSAKLDSPGDYDVAVGLSLHEGSHIKLSDFTLLERLWDEIASLDDFNDINKVCKEKNIPIVDTVKDILNWVEDRRIDNYIYSTSPGYRTYYQALYDRYFNDPVIDKALKSKYGSDETLDSYMFRLINLHSKLSDLSALKGLREMNDIADLPNISRLGTTFDALQVALDIFRVMLRYIEVPPIQDDNTQKSPDGNSETQESDTNPGSGDQTDESSDDSDVIEISIGAGEGSGEEFNPTEEMSPSDETQVKKAIKKQKTFLNGDISKEKISKDDSDTVDILSEIDSDIKDVGGYVKHPITGRTEEIVPRTKCIFIKKMTDVLMNDNSFPMTGKKYVPGEGYQLADQCGKYVDQGFALGKSLGRKLQIRSEERNTVYNRQKIGKIDKRMISSLGFGSENVFYTRETSRYNKANLHISVDASYSMKGSKWETTMVNITAIAVAVSMIQGLEVQITFRTTTNDKIPYIVLAYDSRKDKISKIKNMFRYLTPSGSTPEGLCFEAIMSHMIKSTGTLDSYFLNISDGEPYCPIDRSMTHAYHGHTAATHTRAQIENMKKMGISILSYYVDANLKTGNGNINHIFKKSYGEAAKMIDVTSLNEVSKTLNALFLKK